MVYNLEEYTLVDAFTTMRKKASQIKKKKREIKALYKDWQALYDKIEVEFDDPCDDVE